MEESKAVFDSTKPVDNEVKSELEALMNLDYNLHTGRSANAGGDVLPVFVMKKGRAAGSGKRMEKMAGKSEEKMEPDRQIRTLHNASIEELQSIIRQVALTSEDKYRVLEARDRLMRLKRVKTQSLAVAMATSGTCPDMCPEKERLMRESQRQVAIYEQVDSNEYRINHAKAVKQYSRSSADQEEPMPHELRPVASLKMTMSYLLHEIVPLYEMEGTNLAEWYHFLWDRTRSIRKDITQQELCCVDSVELVEQCARFHIVCSEILCAEDASVFDKKINSENLTKCLQSLKYMYYDLRLKNIVCPNEPEFRAYVILLNLNSGNFMSDVQRLPPSIQKSPEVQFAIQVYNSIASNNYSKFFKLVRKTTYLNACILLRYFNQVRVSALTTMVKAYCRTVSTEYPLYELIDVLGFEDENEAIYFCEQCGLSLSSSELGVMLNRRNFTLPETSIEQGRAVNVVESKRIAVKLSVSRCIAGDKLPDKTYENHKPHNSFDARGYLLPQSINAEDQGGLVATDFPSEDMDTDDFSGKTGQEEEQAYSSSSSPSSFEDETENLDDYQIEEQSIESDTFDETNLSNKSLEEPTETVEDESPTKKEPDRSLFVFAPPITREVEKTLATNEQKLQDNSNPFVAKATSSDKKQFVFSSATVLNKPSIFGQPHQAPVTSPFGIVANRSIFSGSIGSNLFAKPASIPSIFGANKNQTTVKPETSRDSSEMEKKHREDAQESSKKNTEGEIASKRLKEELESRRRIEQMEKQAEQMVQDFEEEVVEEMCISIVSREIERLEIVERLGKNIADETLNRFVEEACEALLKEELAKRAKLKAIAERARNRMIAKYVDLWRCYASKKKKQREALSDTPVWLQLKPLRELAKSLYRPEQNVVIEMMRNKLYRPVPRRRVSQADDLAPLEVILYSGMKENFKSLNIEIPKSSLFFKLVVCWPTLDDCPNLWRYKKIVSEYLCPDGDSVWTEPIVRTYRPSPHESLHVCVYQAEEFVSEDRLTGTDGLLFIAAASESMAKAIERLTKTVFSREKLMPVSLVFVVLGDDPISPAYRPLLISNLESLLNSGYVSEYTIIYEKRFSEKIVLDLAQSSALWLAINKSPPVPLEMDHLKDLLEACLTNELWLRIFDHSSYNSRLSAGLEKPDFIVDLHNEAVLHFMDIILDPESFMYTKFPPELKKFLKVPLTFPHGYEYFDDSWKNEEYRVRIQDALTSFTLPRWSFPWPIENADTLRQSIVDYCKIALPNSNGIKVSCKILSDLFLASGSLKVTSFIDILLGVVQKKVQLLKEDFKVVYNKNHVKHFRSSPWWLKSNAFSALGCCFKKRSEGSYLACQPAQKKARNEIGEFPSLANFCDTTRNEILEVHRMLEDLEKRIKFEREQSELFDKILEEALKDDPL